MKSRPVPYRIRLARKSDIPEILRMAAQYWKNEKEWVRKPIFEKVLKDNPKTCWMLEIEGKIAGARLVKDDFECRAWSWLLVMKPEYRRNGYGTNFWKDTNRILKRRGYRCLVAVCYPLNIPAVKWHKKVGYKLMCKIPKWYYDDTEAMLFYYRLK